MATKGRDRLGDRLSAAADWILSKHAALFAVVGLLLYYLIRFSYSEFYGTFGMSPEEAGLGYDDLLLRSAFGAIVSIVATSILFVAVGVGVSAVYVVCTGVAFLAGIIPIVAFGIGVRASKKKIGTVRTVALVLLFDLIVVGWWWAQTFDLRLTGAVYLAYAATLSLFTEASLENLQPRELKGVSPKQVKLYARYYGIRFWRHASEAAEAVRRRNLWSFVLVVFVAVAVALWGVYLPERSRDAAAQLMHGDINTSVRLFGVEPLNIEGVTVLSFQATPVRVIATEEKPPSYLRSLAQNQCLVYFGKSDGSLMIYEIGATTSSLPEGHFGLEIQPRLSAGCRD